MRTIWETSVFGVLAVTQAFVPLLRKSEAARIVNVSSSLGSLTINATPNPYRAAFNPGYAAPKTALNAITLAFAIDLEAEGIKVNAGSLATPAPRSTITRAAKRSSRVPPKPFASRCSAAMAPPALSLPPSNRPGPGSPAKGPPSLCRRATDTAVFCPSASTRLRRPILAIVFLPNPLPVPKPVIFHHPADPQ
ncbi:MAG: SDR family NAD(P)-dependent oxidoreductase [Candidatus Devosia euplotis]|nr:SDR family NAD(P)-dependent oxidoreductase [Candidatus Devosia euplotis]